MHLSGHVNHMPNNHQQPTVFKCSMLMQSTCHCAARAKLSSTSMGRRLLVQPEFCRMYLEQIQALGLRIDILSLLSMAIMDVSLKYYSK